jgi:hypothetical protein
MERILPEREVWRERNVPQIQHRDSASTCHEIDLNILLFQFSSRQ